MTDYSVNVPKGGRTAKPGRLEYGVYFTLILLVALPVATIDWLASPLIRGRLPEKGPLARARAEACAITTMIFRA
jgi:hypothetical protein